MGSVIPPSDPTQGPAPGEEQETTESVKNRIKAWQGRVDAADRDYKKWEEDYECSLLEGYFTGLSQWPEDEKSNYTINLCFPTMEIKIPSMLFYNPKVRVTPKPQRADDPLSTLDERARLREDTINSFVQDPDAGFVETQLALREAICTDSA
jgi:hypothetical protein